MFHCIFVVSEIFVICHQDCVLVKVILNSHCLFYFFYYVFITWLLRYFIVCIVQNYTGCDFCGGRIKRENSFVVPNSFDLDDSLFNAFIMYTHIKFKI